MSLLDEQDLDELVDNFDDIWTYKWCVRNATNIKESTHKYDLELWNKNITYTRDEIDWMDAQGIEHLPWDSVSFISFIITTQERLMLFLRNQMSDSRACNVYLIVKPDTDLDSNSIPPRLKESFIITTHDKIRGKADGFYIGRH